MNTLIKSRLQSLLVNPSPNHLLKSVKHKNGFFKVVLGHDETGGLWRLHWSPKVQTLKRPHQNPHSHGWSFSSFVLNGAVSHTTYKEEKETNFFFYHKFKMDPSLHRQMKCRLLGLGLNKNAIQSLGILKHEEFKAESMYYMKGTEIHTSYFADNTLTAVCQHPLRVPCDSHVYICPLLLPSEPLELSHPPLSSAETQLVIDLALSFIK